MRLLIATSYRPFPPDSGSPIRVYNLIRELARSHRVSVVTYVQPGEEEVGEALASLGVALHAVPAPPPRSRLSIRRSQIAALLSAESFQRREVRTRQMQATVDRILATESFELVQLEQSKLCGLTISSGVPVVLDLHDVEHDVRARIAQQARSPLRAAYDRTESARLRHEEIRCWRLVDGCVTTSARDEDLVRADAPDTATAVVPNGVDLEYFRPSGRPANPDSIVFVGLLGYRPNREAVSWFVQEVLPWIVAARPTVSFTVVGQGGAEAVPDAASANVRFTGWVRDVRPYLEAASVVVAPLWSGGGTRLKILEAMATGRPVVSTTIGCEGLDARPGDHLLVADDARGFADAVQRLLDAPELASELGRNGRSLVEQQYSWGSVVRRLEGFHRQVVAHR